MRICLDGLPLSRALTGIGHYTLELSQGLAVANPGDEYLVASPRPFVSPFQSRARPNLSFVRTPLSPVIRYWWKFGLSRFLRRRRIELFHGTNYELPLDPPCATVLTIHDLSTLLYPETHEEQNVARARRLLPVAAQRATMVLSPTDAIRHEINQHLKVPLDKIAAIHEASRECFTRAPSEAIQRTKKKYGVGEKFLLYVGTIEPRKNLITLVLAFEQVFSRHGDLQLVIAGRRGWIVEELFNYVSRSAIAKNVIFTGYLTDEELRDLYSGCHVFISPSLYEGFGLPPLEAMACGAPVIASDIASHREVLAGNARLVSPHDFGGLKDSILELLEDAEKRERLSQSGVACARQFSWAKTAAAVRDVYEEARRRFTG